ncbi:MAG: hypothetical protein RDU14_16870 [Melioribacteraceae bacterium]|nr:hypothetical protein [Melioribacteraceae bacterium]
MAEPKWEKVIRDEADKVLNTTLCPVCREDTLERLYKKDDEENELALKERCSKGCYIYNFETRKREK